ncbi:phosphonate C-P lyase system protein PhnH [Rhizobium paknamense]|uniref:Alpha-D-ribose 1-methylphosphonate 5-triphosphate synthase subunit PhnH n=1 Tax=Rhizobium paknamense TaxID=1206817 RepID=A0ABU0ICA0_9HYPH|nr:phosphonate C-P lyase system protein PhnH [Rhizobium paknamense]MDQ0455869.1 alpha-D-ribose 1-methylphosphonate 5-triphosphate synthase subunit PhnH [Rhizobium paknamense]
MPTSRTSLAGGFADPVFDAQAVFRAIMDAMAHPGTLAVIGVKLQPPAPLGPAAGAVMLTLCDHDTPVWLTPGLVQAGAGSWLSFYCGATLTDEKTEAAFAFIERSAVMPPLSGFAAGSADYPDRSTTLAVEVEALEGGTPLRLTGPGIRDEAVIAPLGLPELFLAQWSANHALFPRGVDLILTCGTALVALPRTCRIEVLSMSVPPENPTEKGEPVVGATRCNNNPEA